MRSSGVALGGQHRMIPGGIPPAAQFLYDNRDLRFWAFQLSGWLGYGLVTFFSITVIDGNVSWDHIAHIAIRSVLGMVTSWPLRTIYRLNFNRSHLERIGIAFVSVTLFSGLWTLASLATYVRMYDQPALWEEANYWYFGSFFVFLTWTVLYFAIRFYQLLIDEHQKLLRESALKEREEVRRVRAESQARHAQLQMLRYRINPHFLFNTLNTINAMVSVAEPRRASAMLELLSDFLRYTLEQGELETVTLAQELRTLKLYLQIEQERFDDRLTLEFDVAPEALEARLPGLLLQPLVENSMKYAISPSEEGGVVSIRAAVAGDRLLLAVLDTGPGLQRSPADDNRGLGLRNTRERLDTLYGEDASFELENLSPAGLAIRIDIPLGYGEDGEKSRYGANSL